MSRLSARDGSPQRVILIFVDGLGVGSDDPAVNPLATGEFPTLRLTESQTPDSSAGPPALARGLDSSLGVRGLPQSATGQTTILTGVNAPAAMGKHISGYPGPALREILMEHSILKRIRSGGGSAGFLNAYGPTFHATPPERQRLSATSLATLASGAGFRTWKDLVEGRAVVHDLTHWRMRERGYDLAPRTPEEAGAILAAEAMKQDFSLFEYFETDRAGHDQDRERAIRCLHDLDRAIDAALSRLDLETTTVMIVSDHGNLEDFRVKTHTTNPAYFAAWGPGAPGPAPDRLTDVAPFVYRALGVTSTA